MKRTAYVLLLLLVLPLGGCRYGKQEDGDYGLTLILFHDPYEEEEEREEPACTKRAGPPSRPVG